MVARTYKAYKDYKDMTDEEFFEHAVYLIGFIKNRFTANQIDYIVQALEHFKSEVQEKIYQQEMDKINFCACGCILPDYLTRCSDCEALDDM